MSKTKYTRTQTSLHPEIIDMLNEQVSKEAEASSLYLAMASWTEYNGYSRSAEFFYNHAVEERDHMMKIFRFLNENGARAYAPEVGKVEQEFKSLKEVYEKTLEHEIKVTQSIFAIFKKARQSDDYASENFLQWFVEEQLEEEKLVHSILDLFEFTTDKDSPIALKLIDERIPLEKRVMILVTGGTGMVGSHLLFELTKERARKVRAIYRKERSLESVKRIFTDLSVDGEQQFATIEWVKADLDDIPALEAAFRDVVFVFHCAGFISYAPNDFDKLIKINVEGTATIVNLCLSFGVQKLCYVSSVASLSAAVGKVADEQNEWNPEARNSDYAISKHGGEMEVWRGSQEGLKVIIVNPSIILGRSDYNSGSGLLFKQVASEPPRYTTGGSGYVDAKDVARAMVALQFSEVANERFVLNAANLTYKEIFEKIAKILGVKAPTKPISHKALRFMARVDGFLSFLRLKKRTLTLVLADAGGEVKQYNGEKITKTIDFQYTDIDKTIEEVGKDYVKSQGLGGIND